MKESGQLMAFPRSLVHLDLNNMHGLHQYAATMQAQSSSVSQLDSDRNIFDRALVRSKLCGSRKAYARTTRRLLVEYHRHSSCLRAAIYLTSRLMPG